MDESEIVSLPHVPTETVSAISSSGVSVVSLGESPASQQQKAQLTALLTEHQEIFSSLKGGTGKCTLIQHHVKTSDHPPLHQRAYWKLTDR